MSHRQAHLFLSQGRRNYIFHACREDRNQGLGFLKGLQLRCIAVLVMCLLRNLLWRVLASIPEAPRSHLLSIWTSEEPGPSFSGSGISWGVCMWHLGDLEDTGELTIFSRETYGQQDTSLLPNKAGKVLQNNCPWDASAHGHHGKSRE